MLMISAIYMNSNKLVIDKFCDKKGNVKDPFFWKYRPKILKWFKQRVQNWKREYCIHYDSSMWCSSIVVKSYQIFLYLQMGEKTKFNQTR